MGRKSTFFGGYTDNRKPSPFALGQMYFGQGRANPFEPFLRDGRRNPAAQHFDDGVAAAQEAAAEMEAFDVTIPALDAYSGARVTFAVVRGISEQHVTNVHSHEHFTEITQQLGMLVPWLTSASLAIAAGISSGAAGWSTEHFKAYMEKRYGYGHLHAVDYRINSELMLVPESEVSEEEPLAPVIVVKLPGGSVMVLYPYSVVAFGDGETWFITRMD